MCDSGVILKSVTFVPWWFVDNMESEGYCKTFDLFSFKVNTALFLFI